MRKILPLLAATLLLSGCQTWGPTWSEVTGVRFHRTQINRMPTLIENVDGRSAFPTYPIRIEPGRRVLSLQGIPPSAGWRGTVQSFTLDAEPCKRYYINAQFDNALTASRWTPVIDEVETIAGCSTGTAK